jgi:hypothetical protein
MVTDARLDAAKAIAMLVVLLSLLAVPAPAEAHAYGPFSISVSSGLLVSEGRIDIRWVLDMAETPASATVELIDADADGTVTDHEKDAYFSTWVGSILNQIQLEVDGRALPKEITSRELTLPAGEGGSPALRLVMDLTAAYAPASTTHEASYRDTNYEDYVGWREVFVAAGDGITLVTTSAPTASRTQELTVYPADLGMSVPLSEASFTFADAKPGASAAPETARDPGHGADAPGFQLWPTGILAAGVVAVLVVVMVAANRPARPPRR